MNTEQAVIESIANVTRISQARLSAETNLKAMEIDSLDLTEILFELEDKLAIDIPSSLEMEARFKFETLSDIVVLVDNVRSQQLKTA